MELQVIWFVLIAVLFIAYFFLEGFDFGVGILMPFISRDNVDRRVTLNTIGPFWDANEVWLITAGGAMFAAFPHWYATLFSGFYLPLFLILLALIVRAVGFEFRGKHHTAIGGVEPPISSSSGAVSCHPFCGVSRSPTSSWACPSAPT
jgi:cytochrome bd ubiquinol oxidase subunit II